MKTQARRHAGDARAGFSLLELVIVLGIVMALAVMAAPLYGNSLSRYRAEMAANRIAADLNLARRRARTSSASCSVVFNPATDTYSIPGMAGLRRSSATYVVQVGDAPHRADLVSADFGGNTTVVFDAYGVPDAGGTVVVKSGCFTRTVTLDAGSGRAEVR